MMARIRSIKPEFWTDEKVVGLSPFARLVFIGLWNFVDDHGRAPCSPARLKMQILPADSVDLPQLLAEISGAGLINIYAVDGKQFLHVCGFEKHQKIDKRAKSKYPDPPISAESPQIIPLDQGREGIKEGKGEDAADAASGSDEKQLYDLGKRILGPTSGGVIKKLVTAKDGSIPLARAALETARTKSNPREYLGAIIRSREEPACRPDRSF